jgi:hypothetical protein
MSPINTADLDKLSTAITSSMAQGFAQLQTALISTIQQTRVIVPKATTKPQFLPKGAKAAPADLSAKDAQIVARFAKRGFQVTLKDRNDPNKPFDVRPFKGWLDQGRVVRKGQKSVLGLFHVSQTDALPSAKPAKGKAKKA